MAAMIFGVVCGALGTALIIVAGLWDDRLDLRQQLLVFAVGASILGMAIATL